MSDQHRTQVEHLSMIHSTLMFISEKSPITYHLSTSSAFGLAHTAQVSARNQSDTARVQTKIDLDSDYDVKLLIVTLYQQFLDGVPTLPETEREPVELLP